MKSMQAALKDLSELPADRISHTNKIWMRDLTELCYDIEDSVDAFLVRVDSPASKPHSLIGFRRFIDKIGIIGKVNLVRKAKPKETKVPSRRYNGAMFEEASRLVGIDGPAKKLTNMLTQGDGIQKQKLMVVSIVGVGGLGKTTLANSVYKELGGQFQCQAIVPVSLKPDMKNILCTILRIISGEKCKHAGEKDPMELIQDIRHCLSDEEATTWPFVASQVRYLIVIDDVWDKESWKILNSALIDNHNGSRVIVTTRNLDVGKFCTATVHGAVYELEPLSDEDSKSFFPEDCIINKDSLVRRWVAEGLIDEKHGRKEYYELCERAEGYFVDLVNRSFIQPLDIDLEGIASSCRVHDIILDLLISLSIEENFVVRSDCVELIHPPCKIRRLSLQDNNNKEEIMPATVDVSHVRSVIAFGDAFEWMPPLSRFSVLRVLDLEGFPSKNSCPKDLRNLHHLRYLQLRGYLEEELLEEIGNLRHLEVLDLSNAYVDALPASIVNLTNLQSLLVDSDVTMPDGIGKLSLLQEMSWIQIAPNTVAELGKLAALRVLCIRGLGYNESHNKAFVQSLSNLGNLVGLFISRSGLCSLDGLSDSGLVPARLKFFRGTSSTTFHQLPRWFSKLELLSGLTITVNKFTQDDLEMLGELPSLRFLELEVSGNSTAQDRFMISNAQHHFQSLEEMKFLHYEGCSMVFAERVMPMLQKLQFFFQLWKRVGGGLDIGLENLTSLKHITVQVDFYKAKIVEVEDVEAMFKDVVRIHPNYPTLELSRVREWQMAEEGESYNSPGGASDHGSFDFPSTDGESDNDSEASEET
ncbi:hypothetical protein C2845_PM13G07640 [Panicum miliaceum]|uniref:NB-ARC domain-containing protein n=1 Tax=Panicum miliaceum TaxID=4540 RepID=A0A3L6RJR6_PANMI|nr:hypothetical protein C2845_PM13G07640 [Panicum miliaceum]